jgi:hypothetical protein
MTSEARSLVIRRFPGALTVALSAVAALGAGCGNDGGAATTPNAADDFVGTWLYSTDTQSVLQCENGNDTNQPPQPNKTFAHGASAALVDLSESPILPGVFCDFAFDVSGPVATAQPNQACALTSLDNLTIDQPDGQAPSWTFSLTSATTAEEVIKATAHFSVSGQPNSCSWTLAAHLTRISKD